MNRSSASTNDSVNNFGSSGNGGGNGNGNGYWRSRAAMPNPAREIRLDEIRDSLIPRSRSGGNVESFTFSNVASMSTTDSAFRVGLSNHHIYNGQAPSSIDYLLQSTSVTSKTDSHVSNAPQKGRYTATSPHADALLQIKQSLLPYETPKRTNTDTLSSESSSGTNGSADDLEAVLLEKLVSMGFPRDKAWHALSLTQFRGLPQAVDILRKANNFQFQEPTRPTGVSRKPSSDNGDSTSSRSESPMQPMRIPTPQQNRVYPPQNMPSTSPAVYSTPFAANQRTPSPLSKTTTSMVMPGYVTVVQSRPMFPGAGLMNGQYYQSEMESGYLAASSNAASANTKRSHITVSLQPTSNGASASADVVKERVAPVILQADKRRVVRPVPQNAVSPTIVVVNNSTTVQLKSESNNEFARQQQQQQQQQHRQQQQQPPTPVLSARFDSQNLQAVRINVHPGAEGSNGGHYVNYRLEANMNSGQVVSIQGHGDYTPYVSSTDANANEYHQTDANSYFNLRSCQQQRLNSAVKSSQRILLSVPSTSSNIDSLDSSVAASEKSRFGQTEFPMPLHHQAPNYHLLLREADECCTTQIYDQSQQVLPTSGHLSSAAMLRKRDSETSSSSEGMTAAEMGIGKPMFGGSSSPPPPQTQTSTANVAASRLQLARNVDYFINKEAEETEDEPIRRGSPLPESIQKMLDNNTYEREVKCTPIGFKFYMEQHIENLLKQRAERETRRKQLDNELIAANFQRPVQCKFRKLLLEKESQHLRRKRQKMNASLFDKLTTIGVGAFGEVSLVRQKGTNFLFAMKTLRKSEVLKKNQAAHVKAERDILAEADNEWVVKLFYSFQDEENLFFIMEYIPGGDMMTLLIKQSVFKEDLARFYIAELVAAIASVHKLGFIHRDIKPDNILIDANGHIKLTDFGLCTGLRWTHDWKVYAEKPKIPGHVHQDSFDLLQMRDPYSEYKVLDYRYKKQRREAHSLVGTPNYIAPEVLLRNGHTQLCDWWSVGVILYEMVFGRPPFFANTPEETQMKVVNWKDTLQIPQDANISDAAKDLILRLCCGIENRLGREEDARDIKEHSFFTSIDWKNLRNSKAPYRPEIRHATDTSNFDPVEPRPDPPPSYVHGSDKLPDHAFYEFTFRRFFDFDGLGCPTLRLTSGNSKLETVLESAQGVAAGGDGENREATSENSRARDYTMTSRSDQSKGKNILWVNTDERDAYKCRSPSDVQLHVDYLVMDNDLEYSGPGRPEDADEETSDSAVYV